MSAVAVSSRKPRTVHSRLWWMETDIRRQLGAFGVDLVMVSFVDLTDKKKGFKKIWTPDELLENLEMVQAFNAQGMEIYIMPWGDQHSICLVDDVKRPGIEKLKQAGYNPCLIIETSKDNFQCWIKLSDQPVAPLLRKLAVEFFIGFLKPHDVHGGDFKCKAGNHPGRLAQCTNNKPKRKYEGRPWMVKINERTGRVAEKGSGLVMQLEKQAADAAAEAAKKTALRAMASVAGTKLAFDTPSAPCVDDADAGKDYKDRVADLFAFWDALGKADRSAIDWQVSLAMALTGRYSRDAIHNACLAHSLKRDGEKHQHYAMFTIRNLFCEANVRAVHGEGQAS